MKPNPDDYIIRSPIFSNPAPQLLATTSLTCTGMTALQKTALDCTAQPCTALQCNAQHCTALLSPQHLPSVRTTAVRGFPTLTVAKLQSNILNYFQLYYNIAILPCISLGSQFTYQISTIMDYTQLYYTILYCQVAILQCIVTPCVAILQGEQCHFSTLCRPYLIKIVFRIFLWGVFCRSKLFFNGRGDIVHIQCPMY